VSSFADTLAHNALICRGLLMVIPALQLTTIKVMLLIEDYAKIHDLSFAFSAVVCVKVGTRLHLTICGVLFGHKYT
jgi:hypothetical protein